MKIKDGIVLQMPHKNIKKKCKICGKNQDHRFLSSWNKQGIPQYRARCQKCFLKRCSELRKGKEFKTKRNKKRKENLKKRTQYAIKYLGGKCQKCGYNGIALTFHHRNPKEKAFDIGRIKDYNEKIFNKELDKCDLLCFNCHMEIHWEE